jgi:hypothetical protein
MQWTVIELSQGILCFHEIPVTLHLFLRPTMSYTIYITETSYTSVSFDTKEEAEAFMEEPDYDLCRAWELGDAKIELVEEVTAA